MTMDGWVDRGDTGRDRLAWSEVSMLLSLPPPVLRRRRPGERTLGDSPSGFVLEAGEETERGRVGE